jgi:hypothetical protein
MAILATLDSSLLRCIKADMSYVFAFSFKGELTIDDNGSPLWQVAEGREAAHMLLRLYNEQPSETRRKILDILAALESAAHTAPPKG